MEDEEKRGDVLNMFPLSQPLAFRPSLCLRKRFVFVSCLHYTTRIRRSKCSQGGTGYCLQVPPK